ncbi:hypothetical protein EDB85DRAFT_2225552, partial [Lactarius pseudohatsudake]
MPPFRANGVVRTRGKAGAGTACTRVPLFCAYRVACTRCAPFRANGEGWARVWRARAYGAAGGVVPSRASIPRAWGGTTQGRRGGAGGGVPACTLSARMGEGGAWGGVPSRSPRGRGGNGRCRGNGERGRHALARPPSARMGKGGGAGVAPSRASIPRVRAGVAQEKGRAGGGMPSCTPLPREWGRVRPGVCPRVSPSRAYGAGRGGVGGDGERGRHALAHPLPRKWGRVGPGAACPRVPPSRTYRGAANGEGWRRVACFRMLPSCAYGAARPKGKGRCRGRRVLVRPFMGREGPGGAACPRAP